MVAGFPSPAPSLLGMGVIFQASGPARIVSGGMERRTRWKLEAGKTGVGVKRQRGAGIRKGLV